MQIVVDCETRWKGGAVFETTRHRVTMEVMALGLVAILFAAGCGGQVAADELTVTYYYLPG